MEVKGPIANNPVLALRSLELILLNAIKVLLALRKDSTLFEPNDPRRDEELVSFDAFLDKRRDPAVALLILLSFDIRPFNPPPILIVIAPPNFIIVILAYYCTHGG